MIILIGAESSTGKTLMAQRLLELYHMPYLSVDHLKMGLVKANRDCGFTQKDSNENLEQYLWPIVKGIIETNIENRQHVIIEGSYLFPCRLKEFSREYKEQIIPVFMVFSRQYLENNFTSCVLEYRNSIELRKEPEERPLEWFVTANERFRDMCRESGIRYFEIQDNYNDDIRKVYQWIAEEVGRIQAN